MTRIFVYGSLKRGYWNNDRCLKDQTFIGEAETAEAYRLFDLGSYPGMVEDEKGISIKGEIWEIDDRTLRIIDGMEIGAGYERKKAKLKDVKEEVFTYIYKNPYNRVLSKDCGREWHSHEMLERNKQFK